MSAITEKYNKAAINQMFVTALAEDGAVCNYSRKEYDEQATYNGGEGPRRIFQNLNNKVKTYHNFLKFLLGEDHADINEDIPVIDYYAPQNSTFLYTYPVKDDKVDSTLITLVPSTSTINRALSNQAEAEYFYNTRSSVAAQSNILAGGITSTAWAYHGIKARFTITNGVLDYRLQKAPILYYYCTESDGTKLALSYLTQDELKNTDNSVFIPYSQNYPTGLQVLAGKSSYSKAKQIFLLADGVPSDFDLPTWATVAFEESTLGPVNTDSTYEIINLAEGDFIVAFPDYSPDFICQDKVFIFKHLPMTGHIPTDGSNGDVLLHYAGTDQNLYYKDNILCGDYLVFMAYAQDLKPYFEFSEFEADSVLPEEIQDFLNGQSGLFEDFLQLEKWYFGETSGIMNGLYSTPYEYDQAVSDIQLQTNFANDELKYPRVLSWKYQNDASTGLLHGMSLSPGLKYYSGHLLNRGKMLSSPFKRSSHDPVKKALDSNGLIISFQFSDGFNLYWGNTYEKAMQAKTTIPPAEAIKVQEYLGKAEIYYDTLLSRDLSSALFTEVPSILKTETFTAPPLFLSSGKGVVTLSDFPTPKTVSSSSFAFPSRLLKITSSNALTGDVRRVAYTSNDIMNYLETFFDSLHKVEGHPEQSYVSLDYRRTNDLGLYQSTEEYAEYSRLTGVDVIPVDKHGNRTDGGSGSKAVKDVITHNNYEAVAAVIYNKQTDTEADLETNGAKSFLLKFNHRYVGTGDTAPQKPQITEYDSAGNAVPSAAVSSSNASQLAYGLNCSLQILTPMDTFRQKNSLNNAKTVGRGKYTAPILVYPALESQFPQSMFLFTCEDLEVELLQQSGSSIQRPIDANQVVPLTLYDPVSGDFLMFQVFRAWHFRKSDYERVHFYTEETGNWELDRPLAYPTWIKDLASAQQRADALYRQLQSMPDYTAIKVSQVRSRYTIAWPTAPASSTQTSITVDTDNSSEKAAVQVVLKGLGYRSLKDLKNITQNLDVLTSFDKQDLNRVLTRLSSSLLQLLNGLFGYAVVKKEYDQLIAQIAQLKRKIADDESKYVSEFHCYQLQPFNLKLDFSELLTLYQQELSGTQNSSTNSPIQLMGNTVEIFPTSSSPDYFAVGQELADTPILDRSSVPLAQRRTDLAKLGRSRIILSIPDLLKHSGSWYWQYGTGFYKDFGHFLAGTLNSGSSPLKRIASNIIKTLLSRFQLSVQGTETFNDPLRLSELPSVLDGLFALRQPLTTLALSGAKIPLVSTAVNSYAAGSQADLGDLQTLLLRYDNDLAYLSLDQLTNIDPQSFETPDFTGRSQFILDPKICQVQYTYPDVSGKTRYASSTQLLTVSSSDETQIIVSPEVLYRRLNEYGASDWSPNPGVSGPGEDVWADITDPVSFTLSIPSLLAQLKGDISEVQKENLNRLLQCAFKSYLRTELVFKRTAQATTGTKTLKSFSFLKKVFGSALTDAASSGFSAELCRLLDQYFGDGTRPFFNMEERSCSLAVDQVIKDLKQGMLQAFANASSKFIYAIQFTLELTAELDTLWQDYFSTPITDRSGYCQTPYIISPEMIKKTLEVNFSSPDLIKPVLAELLTSGSSGINPNFPSYTPYGPVRTQGTDKVFEALSAFQQTGDLASFDITSRGTQQAIRGNLQQLYQALPYVVATRYNQAVNSKAQTSDGKIISFIDLTQYLAREEFLNPDLVVYYDLATVEQLPSSETYYEFDLASQSYQPVTEPVLGQQYFIKRWGWFQSDAGSNKRNNFYYIPAYVDSQDNTQKKKVSPSASRRYLDVEDGFYQTTLNLHLPEFSWDADSQSFQLASADLNSNNISVSVDPDSGKQVFNVDNSEIFQIVLPVPNGSINDANEVLLKAIADLSRQALAGQAVDQEYKSTMVRMTETDTAPSGDPSSLYYKRYQALNARMNRLTGPLYSAARALKNGQTLQDYTNAEQNTLKVYEDLMTVIPVAQFDELTYLPTQTATASTIPLDGRFYYDKEMQALREQISDKCVLTCQSCSVKENCIFYNEDEILKLYCTPAVSLNLYFKDNKLDMLYYDEDPDNYSPDIYEYQETLTNGVKTRVPVGESLGHEYFQALHKPYSEMVYGNSSDKISEIRPLKQLDTNILEKTSSMYILPSLEEEFRASQKLDWNDRLDGQLGWLTGARYGTVELNETQQIFNSNYPSLQARPYKYLYNALWVFDEESEFTYQPSEAFYDVKDIYIPDSAGLEHRFGGRTRIWVPITLKVLLEANENDDVYLVSDDTADADGNALTPVIYLDSVKNLLKPGRTWINFNTTSTAGVMSPDDQTLYASDVANWSVRICKNHNSGYPASSQETVANGTHHALLENRDQYWMETLNKNIAGPNETPKFIDVPGRPRTSAGYQEPLLDPDNPDEAGVLAGKPVTANYINFIRQFSIRLCERDPEDLTKVKWYIKWIKGLDNPETASDLRKLEEKHRTLSLMRTNLRLVIIRNN